MQVDHRVAAGTLVQAIHVLGEQQLQLPRRSSAARAWWVPLGRARPKRGQPSRLRAQ